MNKVIRPRKVMTTLSELWVGNRCPHESRCACRKGHWCPEAKVETNNGERDYPMMHLAGCSFSYDRCCCQVLEEIEMLAGEYLEQGGVKKPPVPLDLMSLFDSHRSIEVRYLPLKRYLGCTWFVEEEWVVQINENIPSELRRFTTFHEGFHVICGSSGFALKHAGDGHRVVGERLADYFAASILMPKDFVSKFWPQIGDVGEMANMFAVPVPAMKDWLARLCLATT
ncbi:ImmA/IrrE family metallo-endopeptidase [Chloroflexota bacterium]